MLVALAALSAGLFFQHYIFQNLDRKVACELQSSNSPRRLTANMQVSKYLQRFPRNAKENQDMRASLLGGGESVRREIERVLLSGYDVEFPSRFEVGPGGALVTSNSLRVMLIDLLPTFDTRYGARFSRKILPSALSSEEVALLLRNYAWGYKGRDLREEPEFIFQIEQLLRNKEWRNSSRAGYLESFDLVVFARNFKLLRVFLEEVFAEDAPDKVKKAGALALLRIAAESRPLLYRALLDNSSKYSISESLRAAVFAYADVQNQAEATLLSRYLLQLSDGSEQREFADKFPLAIEARGNFLLTEVSGVSLRDRAQRDIASLEFLEQLPEEQKGLFRSTRNRLAIQINNARRGGFIS